MPACSTGLPDWQPEPSLPPDGHNPTSPLQSCDQIDLARRTDSLVGITSIEKPTKPRLVIRVGVTGHWQVARASTPKNHHELWKVVPRSSRHYRDERAGGPVPTNKAGCRAP
jgi:hypothetical protein